MNNNELVTAVTDGLSKGLRPSHIAKELNINVSTMYARLLRAGYRLEAQPMELVPIHPQKTTAA